MLPESLLLHRRDMMLRSVKSLSPVGLFVTPWTVACQPPLSMVFSKQEYWSGLPFLTQESNLGDSPVFLSLQIIGNAWKWVRCPAANDLISGICKYCLNEDQQDLKFLRMGPGVLPRRQESPVSYCSQRGLELGFEECGNVLQTLLTIFKYQKFLVNYMD